MAWREGALPLRNRWNGCGSALAANGSSAAFSPMTILAFLLSLPGGFSLAAALKIFLALTGTWLWLKALGVSDGAALFAAVAFSFSLTMTAWIFFPQTAVLCLWPWTLFAIETLRDPPAGRRAFWLLVLLFFLWPLAGHIESAASGAAFAGLWLVTRVLFRDLPDAGKTFSRLALAAVLALGLSAFSLLPQVLAILASNRFALVENPHWTSLLSWAPHGPVWKEGVFTLFFPRALGDGIRSPVLAGAPGSFPEMGLSYFGIVGWGALLLILRPGSPRKRPEWALLALLVAGFGAAVALWPFLELVGLLPGLRLMLPLRFLSWVALAGPAIAAFELDRFARDAREKPNVRLFPAAVAAILAVFALAVFRSFRELHAAAGGLASQKNALMAALFFLALFGLVPALFAPLRELSARRKFLALQPVVSFPLTLLCAAELLYQGARLYRYRSPAAIVRQSPLVSFLRGEPGPFRVAGQGAALFPNTNVFAELEDIRTHDPVERRDYVLFLDATAGYTPSDYFKLLEDVNAPVLDFLNVKYLIAGPEISPPGEKWKPVYSGADGTVFENLRVLPRVFAPPKVRVASPSGIEGWIERAEKSYGKPFRELFASLDWESEAILSSDPLHGFPLPRNGVNGRVTVSDYKEETNSASFRAQATPGGATLVTSLIQDGGWSALNQRGEVVPTGRANGPFLALGLGGGEQIVRLRYLPPGFPAGLGISAATLGGLLVSLLLRRRKLRASSRGVR